MKSFVVDASVAIKWYLPEPHDAESLRLLNSSSQLLAPDILFPELGNILWKRVTRAEFPRETAVAILTALETVPFQIWPSKLLIHTAFELACHTKRTLYDSLYLALAISQECPLVTADLKLYNALKKSLIGKALVWVEDIPS